MINRQLSIDNLHVERVGGAVEVDLRASEADGGASAALGFSAPPAAQFSEEGTVVPPVNEIEIMLELLMEDLNLTEDKKEVLRRLPTDRKWAMLQQHLSERYREGLSRDLQQDAELGRLRANPDKQLLVDLVVSLRSRPIRWISNFIDNGGLEILLTNLAELGRVGRHDEYEELYIKCLKSLMNNKIGLSAVLDSEGALDTIALSLQSPSLKTKSLVLEILGAVCLIPGGHECVLNGMEQLCHVARTRFRFEAVVHTLWLSCQGMTPVEKDLQVAAMSFINAVICGGPGLHLEFRMHIRSEFLHLGLHYLIDKIGALENELLQTQIDVWIAGLEADEEEVYARINVPEDAAMDRDDGEQFIQMLGEGMKGSSCWAPYLSIMKHLALCPHNPFQRMKYMFILDKLVQLVVLQKDNEDPDPAAIIAELDVQAMVAELADTDKIREYEDKYRRTVDKVKRLEREVEESKKALDDAKPTDSKTGEATTSATGNAIDNKKLVALQKEVKELENLLMTRVENVEGGGAEWVKKIEEHMKARGFEIVSNEGNVTGAPPGSGGPPSSGGPPPPPPPPGMGGPPPPPPPPGMGGPPPPPPPPGMGGPPPPPPPPGMGGPPPPPPPPGMGGPPPPPPPGGPPGPPPPPGMGGPPPPGGAFINRGPPPKPLNLSSKPLKSFNWTKLPPQKATETIWKSIDDAPLHNILKQNEIYNEFEDLFAAKEVSKKKEEEKSTESIDKAAAKPQEISFLDPKRAQNCNIMLKAIKLDAATVRTAISAVDTTILNRDTLTQLITFIPADDELAHLSSLSPADLALLAPAEKFLHEVSGIKFYEKKLKALHFKTGYRETVGDCSEAVGWLKEATGVVMEEGRIKKVLGIVLALGNYMNAGQRGGAYGFKLNSILKMADTKSTVSNRKHTLLHYLTELIEKQFPELLPFTQDLSPTELGAKVNIPTARQNLKTLRDAVKELEALLETLGNDSSTKTSDVQFISTMKSFFEEAKKKSEELTSQFADCEKEFEKALLLYGEDPKTSTPEEFFGVFWGFVQGFERARTENEEWIKKEEDREKKEREKKEREAHRRKKREGHMSMTKPPEGSNGEGLDDLISAIRTGKAFSGAGERQRRGRPGISTSGTTSEGAGGDTGVRRGLTVAGRK
ncbi:formin homology 2 domain-containing protein [Gaertneriomyces semiglobifer]|nr:formin homology 2 domain-containing protein [Gaertneriomyces semiglobifer]